MTIRMTGGDGKALDEIEMEADDSTGATVRGRMERLGGECGYDTAQYLKSRAAR